LHKEEADNRTKLVLDSYWTFDLKTTAGLEEQIRLKYIFIMNIQFELDNMKEQAINRLGFKSIIKN
jgi:hypothetical protein